MIGAPDSGLLAGWLLAGSAVVGVVLVGPTAFISPQIWGGPREIALPLIARHAVRWRAANAGFATATVMTAAGLALLPGVVGDPGSGLAWVAAIVFALAAVPWLVALSIRLWVTPGVAAGYVEGGDVDPSFEPLARLSGALFSAFVWVGSAALITLGGAIVLGGVLAPVVGWGSAVGGVLILGSYVAFGDTLPAFLYVPTTAVGIALLLGLG